MAMFTVSVAPNLPTDGSGQIVVTVTSLGTTRVNELVLRWVRPAGLDKVLAAAERAAGPPADPSAPPAR